MELNSLNAISQPTQATCMSPGTRDTPAPHGGGPSMQDPGPCSSPFMPGPCPYLIQSHGEGSGGQGGWGIIPGLC